MGNVWFTSDLHFGHKLVSGLRGFDDPTEHDDALCCNWAEQVGKRDQVWVLGDLAVSSPAYALGVLSTLPGEKHLIAGNHDPVHSMHRDAHKFQEKYLEVFASVQTFARRRIDGQYVMLSHFPYDNDTRRLEKYQGVDKFAPYRLRDEGLWLLHGHTHENVKQRSDRQIHVGVDAWDLSPVDLSTIQSLMTNG